jgi:hypothetical protein
MIIQLAFQKILKGLLHAEDEDKHSHKNMEINKSHKTSE